MNNQITCRFRRRVLAPAPTTTLLESRIKNKEVRANSSISAIRTAYYPFLEERAILGVIDAAVVGAGAKTRLESRIKKFTPHCVCRYIKFEAINRVTWDKKYHTFALLIKLCAPCNNNVPYLCPAFPFFQVVPSFGNMSRTSTPALQIACNRNPVRTNAAVGNARE